MMPEVLDRRAWVLDTDLGWDPDDVIALMVLYHHALQRREPLVVITSAEVTDGARARAVRWILRQLGDEHDEVLVISGAAQTPSPTHAPQGIATSLEEASAHATTAVVSPALALDTIQDFICRQRAEGRSVCWIGIGASTNLAALLARSPSLSPSSSPFLPCLVVSMLACWPDDSSGRKDVETNVRLDHIAACAVVAGCEEQRIPLAIVPLDTTGFGLLWHARESGEKLVDVPDVKRLLPPAIADVIRLNCGQVTAAEVATAATGGGTAAAAAAAIGVPKKHYNHPSALHDPLTVIIAIRGVEHALDDGEGEAAADAATRTRAPLFARSRLELEPSSGLVLSIAAEDKALRARRAVHEQCLVPAFWTDERFGKRYTSLEAGDAGNCSIALGPLTYKERKVFVEHMSSIMSTMAATTATGASPASSSS